VNFAYRTVCNSCGGTNKDQAALTQDSPNFEKSDVVKAMNKGANSQDAPAGYGSSENMVRPSSRYTPY